MLELDLPVDLVELLPFVRLGVDLRLPVHDGQDTLGRGLPLGHLRELDLGQGQPLSDKRDPEERLEQLLDVQLPPADQRAPVPERQRVDVELDEVGDPLGDPIDAALLDLGQVRLSQGLRVPGGHVLLQHERVDQADVEGPLSRDVVGYRVVFTLIHCQVGRKSALQDHGSREEG